jgi:transposase
MKITTIGLDLAKRIFQVHGVDATGQVLVRKSLRRSQILVPVVNLIGLTSEAESRNPSVL